jgi:hypothetical protein
VVFLTVSRTGRFENWPLLQRAYSLVGSLLENWLKLSGGVVGNLENWSETFWKSGWKPAGKPVGGLL